MTPDWAARATAVPYAVFGDPQTLNLYTYVENAPVNRVDADGHCSSTLYPALCGGGGNPSGMIVTSERPHFELEPREVSRR